MIRQVDVRAKRDVIVGVKDRDLAGMRDIRGQEGLDWCEEALA